MIDYQRIYHTGLVVSDVADAMKKYSEALSCTWANPFRTKSFGQWTPERGQEQIEIEFTYTCEGPQHIELLCGAPGSLWDPSTRAGIHHVGLWSDDIKTDVGAGLAAGWQIVAAEKSPDEGYGIYCYVQSTAGMMLEFVTTAGMPNFEAWWQGGDLKLAIN